MGPFCLTFLSLVLVVLCFLAVNVKKDRHEVCERESHNSIVSITPFHIIGEGEKAMVCDGTPKAIAAFIICMSQYQHKIQLLHPSISGT
jgi:hypothetical protein